MDCARLREAVSAELDGEPTGVSESLLSAHLARCADCTGWRERAISTTRRLRLTTATPAPDLYERIVLSTRPRPVWLWLRRVRTALLLVCALGQVALSVPDLAGDAMPAADGMADHGMHEVAVFGLALAVVFVAGVIRPRLAAGLAWAAGAAAVGLLATALADIVGRRTFEAHETQHLVPIVGALLLAWVARDQREPHPGPARLGVPRPAWPVRDRADQQQGDAA